MVNQPRGSERNFRQALSDRVVLNAKAESKDMKLSDGGALYLLVTAKGGQALAVQISAERDRAPDVPGQAIRPWAARRRGNSILRRAGKSSSAKTRVDRGEAW